MKKCFSSLAGGEASRLTELIKGLESKYDHSLQVERPYVLRLDGVAFRNLTKYMEKPFDFRFTHAMLRTTKDLMERCSALTGFCQSDEITLVFAPEPSLSNIIYSGRVVKIASVMASFAASRFAHHIQRESWNDSFSPTMTSKAPNDNTLEPSSNSSNESESQHNSKLFKSMTNGNALGIFDARVFDVPSEKVAMESIYWRHFFDCRRNVINSIGQKFIKHQKMQNMSLMQVLNELKFDPFTVYHPSIMYGVFFKRKQVEHCGWNPIQKQSVLVMRNCVEMRSFDWIHSEDDRIEMTMSKYWQSHHPASICQIPE